MVCQTYMECNTLLLILWISRATVDLWFVKLKRETTTIIFWRLDSTTINNAVIFHSKIFAAINWLMNLYIYKKIYELYCAIKNQCHDGHQYLDNGYGYWWMIWIIWPLIIMMDWWMDRVHSCQSAFKVESKVSEPVDEAIDQPQIITLFSSIS